MLRGFNQNGHGYSTVAMIFTAAFGVLGLAGMILGKAEPPGQPRGVVQQTPIGIRQPPKQNLNDAEDQ